VVEKETEQIEVSGADLSAQEEIVTQAAVEVLDQGAGTVKVLEALFEGLLKGEKAVMEWLV
jgi:trans-aconitate methyltransferase